MAASTYYSSGIEEGVEILDSRGRRHRLHLLCQRHRGGREDPGLPRPPPPGSFHQAAIASTSRASAIRQHIGYSFFSQWMISGLMILVFAIHA